MGGGEIQQRWVCEAIIDDDISAGKRIAPGKGEKSRIAGSGADEIYLTAHVPTGQCSISSSGIGKCFGLPVARRAPMPAAAAAMRQSPWPSVMPLRA